MRSVYTFSFSPAERVAAFSRVFSAGGPAREQLSLHAEMYVEPVGWDALWKLSKEFCKKFDVRFPCVSYVSVTSVDFEALAAVIEVQSVQHETVSLPECVQDVPLVDLWPTIKQREQCIDVAMTAEFIDLLRFFYNNIWMPWDDHDDKVLLTNTIEERMQLWTEIQNNTIPLPIAMEITLLRNSAIDAHERLKVLDLSLCEEDDDGDDSLLPPNYLTLCAELTAKLETYQAKWPLYEKALIRQQYLARENSRLERIKSQKNVVALWQGGPPSEFRQLSEQLQHHLSREHTFTQPTLTITPSAEQALALQPEDLVICSPKYELPEMAMHNITISSFNKAVVKSSDMRSCLLQTSGQCHIRDLTLHCARVNTTVVARHTVRIQRCSLLDDSSNAQSDFAQGLVAMPDSNTLITDTTFENFYSGIVVHKGASVQLVNCTIRRCGVGIQMYEGAEVRLTNTHIQECSEHCVRVERDGGGGRGEGTKVKGLVIEPDCTIGSGDLQKELLAIAQDSDLP